MNLIHTGSAAAHGRSPYPALHGLENDSWFPDTACSAILGQMLGVIRGMSVDSANKYLLLFEKSELPPTNGTWSLTIYQGNFYVRNAAERYAISPWMPLVYGDDGSLEIYIQADSPGTDKEANWLPTPANGSFNLTIRNYWPKEVVLNGVYKTPPVRRVE